MNSARYQEQVLDGVLLDFYTQKKCSIPSLTFQQDSAPSHTSKSTKLWFSREHIPLFPHPASSPDLSPIEPCWHELKAAIRHRSHPPSSAAELKAAVIEEWGNLPISDIDKHIMSMGDRVRSVLKANGGHIGH
jgi:hypothetical protein